MRTWRGDLLSVAAVLAVPLGLATAFPRAAIGFSAADVARTPAPGVSIVFLDAGAVARAMRTTRILSRNEGGGSAGADLFVVDLPRQDAIPTMPIESRSRAKAPSVVEGGIPPFLPSRRAAAPVRISGGEDADPLPFPRKELLKLN